MIHNDNRMMIHAVRAIRALAPRGIPFDMMDFYSFRFEFDFDMDSFLSAIENLVRAKEIVRTETGYLRVK